jgi:autotransporter-associated beta strand protein
MAAMIIAACTPVRATIYFRNPGNLQGWNNTNTQANCYLYAVSSPAYNGSGGSIEAEDDYQGSGVRYHAEPTTYGSWNTGPTYFGYALYLPSDWEFSGTQRNVTEQYGTETNNGVIFPDYYQAWIGGGTANAYQFTAINGSDENSGTMTAGTWHTIVTEIIYGAGGSVTVWFDGNQAWTQSGTISGGGGGSPEGLWALGLYEADWDGGNEGPQNPRILYDAAITIASDYADANPANYFPSSGAPVWNGGSGSDSDWSDPGNWNGNAIAAGDTLDFGGTSRLNNTNDTTVGNSYPNLNFVSGAGSFSLNGNYVTLSGGIANQSAAYQTNNIPFAIAGSPVLNAGTAGMLLAGGITNPSSTTFTLHLQGTNGTIAGPMQSATAGQQENLIVSLDNVSGASNSWSIVGNNASYLTNLTVAGGSVTLGTGSDAPSLSITNTSYAMQLGTTTNITGAFTMNSGTVTLSDAGGAVVEMGASGSIGVLSVTGGTLNIIGKYIQIGDTGGTGIINQTGGTVTAAASGDFIPGNQTNATAVLNISGGTLTIPSAAFVAFRGHGTWNISGGGRVVVPTLNMTRNSADSPGASGVVNLNGGALVMNQESMGNTGTNQTGAFNFNGGLLQAGAASGSFVSSAASPSVFTATVKSGGAFINDGGFAITVAAPLKHDATLGGAQDGGLTKSGAGTITLTGTNTYNGVTTISGGKLALSGSGSIAASSNIVIAGGAIFDVSALSSTVTLGSGQALGNSSSTAVVSGNVNAASGALSLAYSPGTPSLLVTNGTLTLASNTVLNINNTGAALTPGVYVIIANATNGVAGLVSGPVPSAVVVGGGGFATGTTPSLQIISGSLNLIVTPPTPDIVSIGVSGPTLSIQGTNGAPNGQYVLLESTNLALPFSQWTPVLTDTFDASGNFNLSTNVISPANSQEFYILWQ